MNILYTEHTIRTRNPDTKLFEDAVWIQAGPMWTVTFPSNPSKMYLSNALDDVGGWEFEAQK